MMACPIHGTPRKRKRCGHARRFIRRESTILVDAWLETCERCWACRIVGPGAPRIVGKRRTWMAPLVCRNVGCFLYVEGEG